MAEWKEVRDDLDNSNRAILLSVGKMEAETMAKFIDGKGKLFGKINFIDFLVVVFILCLIPTVIFFPKMMRENKRKRLKEQERLKQVYVIHRPCPNCGKPIIINTIKGEIKGIPRGELIPKNYNTVCPKCGNEVILSKLEPESKPKPILPAINWSQAYDEYLLKEADPEYYKHLLEKGLP